MKLAHALRAVVINGYTSISGKGFAQSASELIEHGMAADREEKFDDAVARFTAALQKNPTPGDAATAYLYRADAYVYKGDFDHASADLIEAIKRDPKLSKAHYLRGYIFDTKATATVPLRLMLPVTSRRSIISRNVFFVN